MSARYQARARRWVIRWACRWVDLGRLSNRFFGTGNSLVHCTKALTPTLSRNTGRGRKDNELLSRSRMNQPSFPFSLQSLLAVWSPERLALIITVALIVLTAGVIVLCLGAFDRAIHGGRMPSKAKGQFYGRVIGWLCLAVVIVGVVWYFNEALFEKLS